MKTFSAEITREHQTDVVVIGGGLAGCAAALAAARHGAKVSLIEESGVLGGQAGFGIVTPLSAVASVSGKRFGGIMDEWLAEISDLSSQYCAHNATNKYHYCCAPQIIKYVLLKSLNDAGVEILFHTKFLSVDKDNNLIQSVTLVDKNGLFLINAKSFIDASGDGDLFAAAGADFCVGNEIGVYDALIQNNMKHMHFGNGDYIESGDRKAVQPVSLFFTMGGVDVQAAKALNNKKFTFADFGITKEDFLKWKYAGTPGFEVTNEMIPTPQGRILVTENPVEGTVVVNMSRVTGIDGSNAESLNEGQIKAQLQLIAIVDFLQTFVPAFKDSYYIQSASSLGIRESRRLHGRYLLSGNEAINAMRNPDTIAKGSYIIDIHDPSGKGMAIGGKIKGDFYDIPYGCLLPKEYDNLLVAGRCISADHVAHSSTRIQGTCILTGQAAGTAAALSLKNNSEPADIDVKELQKHLINDGIDLN